MQKKSLPKGQSEKPRKTWLWNTLITLAVVVGMMGLARIEPLIAWGASALGAVGLAVFFYLAGRSER